MKQIKEECIHKTQKPMLLINIKLISTLYVHGRADKTIKSNNSRFVQDITAKIKLDLCFVVKNHCVKISKRLAK